MEKVSESNATNARRGAGKLVGYLRVSSLDRKELRQLEGMALHKCFVDRASGRDLREGASTGRKHSLNDVQAGALCRRVAAGESKTALADELGISRRTMLGISRRTIYRYAAEYRYAAGAGQ